MTAGCVTVPCWRVYGWGRGRWTLRTTHDSAADAAAHAEALSWRTGARTKVVPGHRRAAAWSQAPPPTDQARFREQEADRMHQRRQDCAYFKSGANGSEIRSITPTHERNHPWS